MIESQDKYKELVGDEPVEAPQPKAETEPQPEADEPLVQKVEEDVIITEEAPIAVTPPTDQVQKPIQQTDQSVKNQVKVLSDIAFEKGLDAAIEEAKKLNNPHILDEFHDILVDELYKKLVEAGKLEQK